MSATPNNFHYIGKGFCGSVWAIKNLDVEDLNNGRAVKREDGRTRSSYRQRLRHAPHDYEYPRTGSQLERAGFLADTQRAALSSQSAFRPSSKRFERSSSTILLRAPQRYCESKSIGCRLPDTSIPRPPPQAPTNVRFQRFSLRNYPLHVDQMEGLQLDTLEYIRAMADALALMH
ncbi:hypothetical protein K458DRAFT_396892 [Lentithecium fluviatile CBS 122367]|uniref:Uncharacterized protein n=1 Tax=Lentithecium fluviatile CBS 122367 TaxID=1168545 RepID=A0A6G1IDZ4_9PLEO|nr:hypothetical protein K458DRAFT_396892 [Lentithecium fluviatile CBS 122367]